MPRMKNTARADGRVQSRVYIGTGGDGKKKYKYVYASTNKELQEKVTELKTKLGKGIDLTAENDTFGYWAERWIELKKMDVSAKRWSSYEYRRHYLDELADFPISKIKSAQIQSIIVRLATSPTEATGKPLARQTLINLKNIACQIFRLAIDNRVMDFNPADGVKVPKETEKEIREPISEEQQRWIRETPHRAQTAAMIMLYAGLRRGELMALTWRDIDLKAHSIAVCKAMEFAGNTGTIANATKSESGMRTVYIPDVLVDYLQKQPQTDFLVSCQTDGKPHSETSWRRMWSSYMTVLNRKYADLGKARAIIEGAEQGRSKKPGPKKLPMLIPTFTPHQLRHTYITMLYLAGVDVLTAKEQAGHADISTTLGIYTHLDKQHKLRNLDKLNQYLSGDGCQMGVKTS